MVPVFVEPPEISLLGLFGSMIQILGFWAFLFLLYGILPRCDYFKLVKYNVQAELVNFTFDTQAGGSN